MGQFLQFGLGLLLIMMTGVRTQLTIADALTSECLENVMAIKLDRALIWKHYLQIDALNDTEAILITPEVASQCGFSLTYDDWGNVQFFASVLNCYSKNQDDETFNLTVRIRVSPNMDMSDALVYNHSMACTYTPWAAREILCERNYMEVSVRRSVPGIKQKPEDDWPEAFLEAVSAAYRIWKVVFYLPVQKTMTASEAIESGYGLNTTPSRLVLRSAYNTSESQINMMNSVSMSVIRATTFYKQKWMVMLVDSAVACPTDGTSFTEDMITWTVPRVIDPLVTSQPFKSLDLALGVDGKKLDPETIRARDYRVDVNPDVITVQFPVGAAGGYYKSYVKDNVYGIIYKIEPMLEHTWKDDVYDETKYKILYPIATPFMPRPPFTINNTVPADRVFNVTLGTFLYDVELVNITFGNETIPVSEANQRGYNVQEHTFPNGTKQFSLQVPFSDPNVLKEITSPDTTTYTLNVTYNLNIIPQDTPFNTTSTVEATLKDIIPPSMTGYCDLTTFHVLIKFGNLGQNFIITVGERQLTPSMADDYVVKFNTTHLWMTVPFNSSDTVFEVIKSSEIRSRLDMTLLDSKKFWVYTDFSLSCCFSVPLIDCFSNGTMAAIAVSVESVAGLDPKLLTLRDPSCKPVWNDAVSAMFQFRLNTCGTTRKFTNNLMTYENEVLMTTSNPQYRFLVACHYLINDTKVVQLTSYDNPAPVVEPVMGNLEVVMNLSLEAIYSTFYNTSDYPVVKFLRAPLYFEVALLYSKDPEVELFLENCWSTIGDNRDHFPKWDIIVDSCENSADAYKTIFHPVSANKRVQFPSHFKRFEVKMFSFTKDTAALQSEIYFHCDVVICDANSPSDKLCKGQCIPNKQRLGRSVESDNHKRAHVSSGLILLKA